MSTAAAAVIEFFPHCLPFLFVLIRENDLVTQPFTAAAAAAVLFPAVVVTPRAYRR